MNRKLESGCLVQFVEGFFGPISALLASPEISEIMINGFDEIFIERGGMVEQTNCRFESKSALVSALRATAQYLGRSFDVAHPILEGRLPDGSRIEAILDPVAGNGPCVAIRRHRTDSLSLEQLVKWGALSDEAVACLESYAVRAKNIIVAGGTGTGKTSLLRCIASLIPRGSRVVTIEDARELHLQLEHVVSLEARPSDARGQGAITIGDLFSASLRLRPDRIVIGELRGGEALDLIQAMTSGHGGCLSTVHASTPRDALQRVETMALFRGLELPLVALRSQIASGVDVVVQVQRDRTGRRYVCEIAEVGPLDAQGQYQVSSVFRRNESDDLVRIGGGDGGR